MEDVNHHDTNQHLPLRLAIICKGAALPRWQASCLLTLLSTYCVEIALIIKEESTEPDAGFITTLIRKPNQSFFNFYMRFFPRCYSMQQVDLSNILSVIPAMQCSVTVKEESHYFSDADIETIRKYDLDVILKLGFGNINGDMLNLARYGIWAFQHDRESENKSTPHFFWEIYRGEDVTEASLQRLTARLNTNIVLKEGFFRTVKYSYAKNMEQCLAACAKWPAQVCIDIANGNTAYLNAIPAEVKERIHDGPNNMQMMLYMIKVLINGLKLGCTALFRHDQWNIGIVHQPIGSFLEQSGNSRRIQWLPAQKKNRYLADPFGIVKNNEITVLCEDFDYRTRKGIISGIGFSENMLSSEPRIVINSLPFHMSYPYLFEYQEKIYCIPETHQAREIGLYRAEEFLYRWVKVGTLLQDIAAVDSTVFQYEGRWWLTCTDEDQGANLNLFAWYADDILGPWKPHAANPVKTDIRSARPAGTPFVHEGYLYRPAQDCSRTYGGRVALNRVLRLTPTHFKEEQAGFIEPDKNGLFPDGLHTLSSVGGFTLVDGKRRVFVPSAARFALGRIMSGIGRKLFPH